MPVIHKIERKDGQRTAVWEIKEDEYTLLEIASLNESDKAALTLISNPGRRLEWLAVRALLQEYYLSKPSINYNENGKPLLINHSDKISISHSGNMVGIALHSIQNPGIDVEALNPRIFKIANRFLSDVERENLGDSPTIEQLTIIWGAKEVMFKVFEHGGISFKEDFHINPFIYSSNGHLKGIINKDGVITPIPMEYMQIGGYMLVQTDYSYSDFEKNSEL